MRSFVKIKSSQNGDITLWITNIGKVCPSCDFLKSQVCLLTLFAKLKSSRKFPDLQYMQASKDLQSLRVSTRLFEPLLLGYIVRIKFT